MSTTLISVQHISGIGSEVATIPVQETRRRVAKLSRVALIALPILVSGAAAMAEDAKTFPGAMCQPARSADPVVRNVDGRMRNAGTSTQTWICPVVRDAVDVATGVEFARIIVTSATASCFFRSMTESGGTVARVPPGAIIPLPGGLFSLQYASGNGNIANVEDGYYHFECRIPADSGVVMYRLDENNDDED